MADLVATALKVSIYKTDSFSFGKYPKNSLLEKTNPILWNRRLLLAFSDIFVFDRSKKHAESPKRTQLCFKLYTAWLTAIFLIIKEFAKNIWGDAELNQQSFGLKVVSISSAMNGAMPAIMWCITGELKRANV